MQAKKPTIAPNATSNNVRRLAATVGSSVRGGSVGSGGLDLTADIMFSTRAITFNR